MGGVHLSSFPWPGPGNSEAPDDSEARDDARVGQEPDAIHAASEAALLATFPWPGPGDSEA